MDSARYQDAVHGITVINHLKTRFSERCAGGNIIGAPEARSSVRSSGRCMVDRIGGKGKGPYRANGGGPDVVTLVRKVRPKQRGL